MIATGAAEPVRRRLGLRSGEGRLRGNRPRRRHLPVGGWLAVAWLVALGALAALAPWLPLDDPDHPVSGLVAKGPGTRGHLLGGDNLGRDLLSRMVFGTRSSLLLGVGAVLLGGLLGGLLGLLAGYYRGRVDAALSTVFDAALAIPGLVLALALVTVLAGTDEATYLQRVGVLVLALGAVAVPVVARVTRATTLTWCQREFVLAARSVGAGDARILVREVLPNVLPGVLAVALLGVALVIVAEGGLSILGVGIKDAPSLGNIIAEGRLELRHAPHIVFSPVAVLFLTVLALNHLSDVVRERSDVPPALSRASGRQ